MHAVGSDAAHRPAKQSKRDKQRLKKARQLEELEFLQRVDERFLVFNTLLCEGSLTQELLVQLRSNAVVEQNAVDLHACEMLIL